MKIESALRCVSAAGLAVAVAYGKSSSPSPSEPARALQDGGNVQIASCVSGASTEIEQSNSYCSTMNEVTSLGEVSTCCAAGTGTDDQRLLFGETDRSLQNSQCRSISTSAPYCTNKGNCDASILGASDEMTIYLDMESASGTDGACCNTCSCYGDPECVSFAGIQDEWIICDGRKEKSCNQNKKVCESKVDHTGAKCKWIKKTNAWTSFQESGSPCQADWATSGYPSMTMYEADGFKLDLTLGERGVIRSATMLLSDGSTHTLDAERCFENDPRTSATPELAWDSNIPSSWKYSTPNEIEVWWNTADEALGIFVEFVCTRSAGSQRGRLNVQNLVETSTSRKNADGFCQTSSISKTGSVAGAHELHDKCLLRDLPELVNLCKAIADPSCHDAGLQIQSDRWCENADLGNTDFRGDIDGCKAAIGQGNYEARAMTWTRLVCQANQLDVNQCVAEVSQFGWESFLSVHSNGLIVGGNGPTTCAKDISAYSQKSDSCIPGVTVEYYKNNKWQEAFFIPSYLPPCNNELKVNAEEYPELFLYKVRFAQCDLTSACLLSNSCQPTLGFQVSLGYETTSCPTPNPTAAPTCATTIEPGNEEDDKVSYTSTFAIEFDVELNQLVCSDDANLFQIGCKEDSPYISANIEKCSTRLQVTVALLDGSTVTCESSESDSLGLGVANTVQIRVSEDQFLTVTKNGDEQICSKKLPKSALPATDQCVWVSAPNKPAADACFHNLAVNPVRPSESCYTCVEGDDSQQKVCADNEGSQESLGACATCCTVDSGYVFPDQEKMCRSLSMSEPYCDLNDKSERQFCKKLKKKDGKLVINIDIDDSTEEVCCHKCTCYGDPECEAFDGSQEKWILCDARDEETCDNTEAICKTQLDHNGKQCVWDQSIADKLIYAADIGALGSPCQSAYDTAAWMDMYDVDDFKARISMGERGVIETLEVTTYNGVYTMVADECFNGNGMSAWHASDSSVPVESALRINIDQVVGDERKVEVTDPITGIFIRISCIERTAKLDKKIKGYRMNIDALIETNPKRIEGLGANQGGYCVTGSIVTGQATTELSDLVHDKCLARNEDELLFCKELSDPSCTQSQVAQGIQNWCSAAVIERSPQSCVNFIGGNTGRWGILYCESIAGNRPLDMTKNEWVNQCRAELTTSTLSTLVDRYGRGVIGDTTALTCGSAKDYKPRKSGKDECVPGIAIETQNNKGEWEEEMFIPFTLPPCGGLLELTAKENYSMFTRPWRATTCEIDQAKCAPTLVCLPSYGYDITFAYSHEDSLCPTN